VEVWVGVEVVSLAGKTAPVLDRAWLIRVWMAAHCAGSRSGPWLILKWNSRALALGTLGCQSLFRAF
jgi:hypothetical protein